MPFDKDFVTYVWFDALVNYISIPAAHGDAYSARQTEIGSSTELWPADVHVIGKDILKFHAVYWPIMLKAMGLPLPKQILVHGWWQKDGAKISKSTGNVVDPIAVIDEWGLDAFRFYVLRELDIGPDGNWTDAGFRARYSAELANGLGNLVNRSLSMLKRYRNGIVPAKSDELSADAQKSWTKHTSCSNKTNCKPRCKASGRSSRARTNTLTKPRRSNWRKTRRRQNDLMKFCIIWPRPAAFSPFCSGHFCRERR